ncbi:hypothetical protein L9F63_011719 [Diploptera punctata]|uniref:Uncharacterized protein n=1 Tax=Diploptera punctata TaxID=6984 RepID=A0AAD8AE79_DIPPU|nr:hypothetical protein L9F63_011719 [Diploptera punctata]
MFSDEFFDLEVRQPTAMSTGSLEAQLQALSEKLALRASRTKICQAEQKLYNLQANSSQCRNLHDHINIIKKRREELKTEISKLSSKPKFKLRYRDTSKKKKNPSEMCGYKPVKEDKIDSIIVETFEYEQTGCTGSCKNKTSAARTKPPACPIKKEETYNPCDVCKPHACPYKKGGIRKTETCYSNDDNLKNQPRKFVITKEVVEEVVEPDNYTDFECPASRSKINLSDNCRNEGMYENEEACYGEFQQCLQDSHQPFEQQAPSRLTFEVSETCIDYDAAERDDPETVFDCCFSEYEKFKNSQNW